MKKILSIVFTMLMVVVLVACSNSDSENGKDSSSDEKQIVMKIGHTMVDNSTRNAGAEKIKEYVEEKSEGRIRVDIYPNSQLGSSKEQVEGVQTGSIEMAIFPSTSVADFQPLFTMMDIPYLIPTEQEKILKMYETDAFKDLMATGDDVGIKVLATWYEGLGTIASKESIQTLDDFAKLKFRIIGGEISHEHYASLGADIDVIAFNEVYTSLQTGRINTIDIPIHQLYDNKFYEVVEHVTKTSHWSLHDFVMVNKDWFDSLPSDLQEIITEASLEAAPYAVDKLNELTKEAEQEMIDYGVNFLEPSDELVSKMKEIGGQLEDKFAEEMGDQGAEILKNLKQEIEGLN